MPSAALAQGQNVNFPLTAAAPRRWRMVEKVEAQALKWGPFICALITVGVVLGSMLFGGGGFFSDTKGGIARLEEQQKTMSARLDQIVDRIEKGPRADQLQDLIRTNAAQDGRLDAMRDTMEARTRALEIEVGRLQIQLQGIQAASGRKLPGDR